MKEQIERAKAYMFWCGAAIGMSMVVVMFVCAGYSGMLYVLDNTGLF